jgi:hypothetical protein
MCTHAAGGGIHEDHPFIIAIDEGYRRTLAGQVSGLSQPPLELRSDRPAPEELPEQG